MKRKKLFSVFKLLHFFLLTLLLLSLLLISGCSPISNLLFGPPGSIEVSTYPSGAKIFLNGNDTGYLTPYTIPNLPKGTYEVKVVLGEISYTKTVIVYADNTSSLYKDLLLRLDQIIVEPTSMNLEVGESQNIDSVTAYYIDSSSVSLALSDCNYSSSSSQATVNSSGTITGVSEGSATITVSYADGEITKTATISITVTGAAVVNIAAIPGVTAPVTGAHPVTTITATAQYTGTVTWFPAHNPFLGSQVYTATITLTAKTGFTLTGIAANFFTVAGTTTDTNPINSGVVTAVFPATAAVINIAAIPGVTAPVTGATPVTSITATTQYTGTVTWSPTHSPFWPATVYTAIINLTAKAGYTLTGVGANFFTVAVATATNPINSGVVTAVFPKTGAIEIGDNYQGGKVAYILQSGDPGYDANVKHGLIAATADQNAGAGIAWSNITDKEVGTGTLIGFGWANTNAIVSQETGDVVTVHCTSGAAYLCDQLSEGGYSDWFLPSKDELNKLCISKDVIDGFGYHSYWSSSDANADHAWAQYFPSGNQGIDNKSIDYIWVRAVRYF